MVAGGFVLAIICVTVSSAVPSRTYQLSVSRIPDADLFEQRGIRDDCAPSTLYLQRRPAPTMYWP